MIISFYSAPLHSILTRVNRNFNVDMLILNSISTSKFHFIYWLSSSLGLLLLVPCGNKSEALHLSSAVIYFSI